MSQAKPQQPEPETEIDKTVQLIAYLSDQSYEDWREYCQDHDDALDYKERTQKERHSYKLKGAGEEFRLRKEQYEKLSQYDLGRLEAVKQTETYEQYENDPQNYSQSIRDTISEAMAGGLEPEWENGTYWTSKFVHQESDCEVKIFADTRNLGMLKHSSEATEDDLFEDKEQRMALEFKIRVTDATPELMDFIDENIIAEFIKWLSKSDEIAQIRTYDCEVETSEKGACLVV